MPRRFDALFHFSGFFALLLLALSPGAALAGEGQIEINQTRALQGGISAGDAPGFPVQITTSGSFRLTSDLVVGGSQAENTTGLLISGDDVTIDLAGFTIRCAEPALPQSVPCAGLGATGDGVILSFSDNVRIFNGTIRDFARHGVHVTQTADTNYKLDDVRILNHGGHGIFSLNDGTISRSVLQDNGGYGIFVDANAVLISEVSTSGNGSGGVFDGNGAPWIARSMFRDGSTGITATDLLGCSVFGLVKLCP